MIKLYPVNNGKLGRGCGYQFKDEANAAQRAHLTWLAEKARTTRLHRLATAIINKASRSA